MTIIICLMIASILAFYFNQNIKKNAPYCYILAVAISCLIIYISSVNAHRLLPTWTRTIVYLFSKATLASALFIIVMYVGILPRKSIYFKRLMPIRAELSIIASILTLGHNISYGKHYFTALFMNDRMPLNLYCASIVSLIMIVIMLPLFITSFKSVRKSMLGKTWKSLQRAAYLFYFLMWLHVILIYSPSAYKGNFNALIALSFYHIIYSIYIFGKLAIITRPKNNILATVIATAILATALISTYLPAYLHALETKREAPSEPTTQIVSSVNNTTQTNVQNNSASTTQSDNLIIKSETTTEMTSEAGQYKDGEYSASANGYVDKIKVRVVIENGAISKVIIEEEQEDIEYMILAEDVVYDIVAQNGTDVDTISGATTSSKAIILAVEKALKNAK